MPKTPHPGDLRPVALRRAWALTTSSVVAATALASATLATAHTAEAAGTEALSTAVPITAAAALVVGGTTFASMDTSLMSTFTTTFATQLINVSYPAQLYPFTSGDFLGASVAAGVNNLLGLLETTYTAGEHLVLWGISQGALVLNAAMGVLANDPHAPAPGDLTFVRVADPAAPITGMLNFLPNLAFSQVLHVDSSVRTAAENSPYNSIVVTNAYDAFADFPDKPWNLLAIANAMAGLIYRHGQTATADLSEVPAQNITTTVNSLGATTTTVVVPSPFLPLTQVLRDAGVPDATVDRLDSVLRPVIDAGYTRNDPAPTSVKPDDAAAPPAQARARAAVPPRSVTAAARSTKSPAVPTPLATDSATPRARAASGVRSTTHPNTTRPNNRTH